MPPLALHVGLTFALAARDGAIRAAILPADGAVMAIVLVVAMASYRTLWLQVKTET